MKLGIHKGSMCILNTTADAVTGVPVGGDLSGRSRQAEECTTPDQTEYSHVSSN